MGKIKKEKIFLKENKEIYQRTLDSSNSRTVPFPVNRKRISNTVLAHQSPSKRSAIDNGNNSEDDLGSRCKTQPKAQISFPIKKKIDALNDLKNGKSIEDVSLKYGISEEKIRDFKLSESEIRQQYREITMENDGYQHAAEFQPKPVEKKSIQEKTAVKPLVTKTMNKPSNIIPKIVEKSPDNSKCTLHLDFEIHNENGKLVFGKTLKKVLVNVPEFTLQLPKGHPDIPKSVPTKKPNLIQPPKKSISNSNIGSNLIPISKPLPDPIQKHPERPHSKTTEKISSKPSESRNHSETLRKQPMKTESKSNMQLDQKPTNKHYPTDPIGKIDSKPTFKRKSSTNKYEPPKNESPFRYLIIDPSSTNFRPAENVDSEMKWTNIESEEFINEVHESYDRFTECVKIYDQYNQKRDELRSRASATQTEKEISELYKEFYRLVEEEKRPFFVSLEKEVTALHTKLTKVANLMGIKLT